MLCVSWTYNLKGFFKPGRPKAWLRLTLFLVFQRLFGTL